MAPSSETPLLPAPIQREEVRRLLPPLNEQIDVVEETYCALARGAIEMPLQRAGDARRSWEAASKAATTPGCSATSVPTRSSSPSTRCPGAGATSSQRTRRGRRSTAPRSSSPQARSSRTPSRRSHPTGSAPDRGCSCRSTWTSTCRRPPSTAPTVCQPRPQLEAYPEHGHIRGWNVPAGSVGMALQRGLAGGRVVACSLGIAALDAAFAPAVLERQRKRAKGAAS